MEIRLLRILNKLVDNSNSHNNENVFLKILTLLLVYFIFHELLYIQ